MKKTLQNQLYLLRFCLQTSPRLFGFHMLACLEIEAFIFLEHTVWLNYNLHAVETGAPFAKIALLTVGFLLLFVLHQLVDSIYFNWACDRMRPVLTQKLRALLYQKAQTMDLSCYDNTDFYNRFILSVTQADQCIDRFVDDSQNVIRYLAQSVFLAGFLLTSDRPGLLIALLCCLVKYFSSKAYYRLVEKVSLKKVPIERERAYWHRVFYLHDYAKELRQHHALQPLLQKDFDACNDRLNGVNQKYGPLLWFLGFLKNYVPTYFLLYMLYLPLLLKNVVIGQTLPVSMMVVLLSCVKRVVNRSSALVELFPKLSLNSAFVEKIRDFLAFQPQITDGPLAVEGQWESLTLSHVYFSYGASGSAKPEDSPPQAGREILHDINMEIRRGQKIALVGYNGAGKTTLVKLLMRLYDPDSGVIQRNGTDIRTLRLSDYRSEIGAVFQDYKIYAAPIRENVVMDVCTRSIQETYEVEHSLFDAHFDLTQKRLKYQIETPLTTEFEKDGVNLSGGESQKVAIARTLYRHQDLIIMDEPSSALDPSAEYRLNRQLQEIAKDKTVIFISHRLSSAYDADYIYMLKKGRIVEQGSHEQLLSQNGEYAKMWKLQASGYSQDGAT